MDLIEGLNLFITLLVDDEGLESLFDSPSLNICLYIPIHYNTHSSNPTPPRNNA